MKPTKAAITAQQTTAEAREPGDTAGLAESVIPGIVSQDAR
jgi:hypothetical protein